MNNDTSSSKDYFYWSEAADFRFYRNGTFSHKREKTCRVCNGLSRESVMFTSNYLSNYLLENSSNQCFIS